MLLSGFGCALIALGPSVSISILTLNQPYIIVLTILSAFFWICSILLAGIIWKIFPWSHSVRGLVVVVAVLIQEAMRYLFFKIYSKAESGFPTQRKAVATQRLFSSRNFSSVIAFGVGFGVTSSLVMYGSVIVSSGGVATFYTSSCRSLSFFFLAALNSMLFSILHIGWSVIAVSGYLYNSKLRVFFVIFAHIAASLATTANLLTNGCVPSLSLLATITLIVVCVALHTIYVQSRPSRTLHSVD